MTMRTIADLARRRAVVLIALLLMALFVRAVRAGNANEPRGGVDLTAFKAMAKGRPCVDIRNRLFVIDDQLVFWEGAGQCADASYGQTLYGSALDQVLCSANDSIAGPMKTSRDEQYRAMFVTMTTNLDKPDLGLGPEHRVQ